MQGFLIFAPSLKSISHKLFEVPPFMEKTKSIKKKLNSGFLSNYVVTQRPQGAAFFLRHRHSEKLGVVFPPPLWPRKAVMMHLLPPDFHVALPQLSELAVGCLSPLHQESLHRKTQ